MHGLPRVLSIESRKDAAKARDRKNEGIDIKVKLNIYRVNTQYAIRVLISIISTSIKHFLEALIRRSLKSKSVAT